MPLLVIHGEADKSVPLKCGEDLFAAAIEPKRWLLVEKGNHLLSSTSHMKKAAREIAAFVQGNEGLGAAATRVAAGTSS